MVDKRLVQQLTEVYDRFFAHFDIDKRTGTVSSGPVKGYGNNGVKFATYPCIGSQYGHAKKVLFIGLDIGKDETLDKLQSFDERRHRIEDKIPRDHNPHIAGTYVVAAHFLRDQGSEWDRWCSTINMSCMYTQGDTAYGYPFTSKSKPARLHRTDQLPQIRKRGAEE